MKNMQKAFWYFKALPATALVTESDDIISYQKLEQDINAFIEAFPKYRALVFLSVNNQYSSLIAYLACLRMSHPFLILESELDNALKQELIERYQPNLYIESGKIHFLSEHKHTFNENLAMMISTSGTTGSPKLVRLSYENLSSNCAAICQYLNIQQSDVAITTLPMSYSLGLSIINTHLACQATIILNKSGVITRDFWNKVAKYNVSTFSGVPFTFQMLKKLGYKRFNTDSIRYLTQAGGKLDEATLEYFEHQCQEQKQDFIVMYGQTEASPRISYLPAKYLKQKIGSIGIAIPEGKLQIWQQGKPITSAFEEGELVYLGKNVMMGYAEKIEDFALGDTQGDILKTGDLGYFDSDGFFYITGRAKRFIKFFGTRISLDEIDNWLAKNEIEAISTGNNDNLVIFYSDDLINIDSIKAILSKKFKINMNYISFKKTSNIPRKDSGKVDFKKLKQVCVS